MIYLPNALRRAIWRQTQGSPADVGFNTTRSERAFAMQDLIANRRPSGYWRKARLLGILLRENGLAWTVLLCAYHITRITAERTFARLERMKLVNGLPGTSSLRMNREIWENWDWTAGGDEWTPSLEWKDAFVRNVLRRWIPENGNILEIGPGAGRWTEILLPMANRFWGVDMSPSVASVSAPITRRNFTSLAGTISRTYRAIQLTPSGRTMCLYTSINENWTPISATLFE